MKRQRLMSMLLLLTAFWLGMGESYAQISHPTMTPSVRQGLRTQAQQNRKASVVRYKAAYQKQLHNKLFQANGLPVGYNAKGYTGKGQVSKTVQMGGKK